jgi:methyl-accepting chemotaxis protein
MIKKNKLNVQIAVEALLLLAVTLGIMAYFAQKVLCEEALLHAEQVLENTEQDIDNILLGVEQSTGNVYHDLLEHLDEPDRMFTYSRKLMESNPNIIGCAIVFKPGYYPGKDLFMAYVHRRSSDAYDQTELVTSETFTNSPYNEQVWYTIPVEEGKIGWIDPLKGKETENEPLVTFCLPFKDKTGERVGALAVDVSLNQLSKIVQDAKPSENGYAVLLAWNGSYIVHPDKKKLWDPAAFSKNMEDADSSEIKAANAMLAGERGMRTFRRDHHDWCLTFKPFERVKWEGRADSNVGWRIGVVYPKYEITRSHTLLLWWVMSIAVVGILLGVLLCRWIIRRQMRPLRKIAKSARLIAQGHYDQTLTTTARHDEIGMLQNRFVQMQQSLRGQLDKLEDETAQLRQQGNMLRETYDKTIEADATKTSLLNYMTNKIADCVRDITTSVTTLCNNCKDISREEAGKHMNNIQHKTEKIVDSLNVLAHFTKAETRKEDNHE